MTSGIVIDGILFMLMIASGIWLRKMGRPLNPIAFNLHKIVTIAAIVLSTVIIYKLHQLMPFQRIETISIILTAVFLLIGLVSGAFLSLNKLPNPFVRILHQISSFLVVILAVLSIYLLINGKQII